MAEIRIRKIEDVQAEKLRLKTQLKYQVSGTRKSIKNLQDNFKPENLLREIANRLIIRHFPGVQNIWQLTGDLRKYYFLKFISSYFSKKKKN